MNDLENLIQAQQQDVLIFIPSYEKEIKEKFLNSCSNLYNFQCFYRHFLKESFQEKKRKPWKLNVLLLMTLLFNLLCQKEYKYKNIKH